MSPVTPPDDDDDGKLIAALDAGEPARTPEETAARLPYQRLIERIQDLDEIEPAPGWEDRAEQRWHAQRADARKRRLRRGALALSLGGAALAAALLLRPCSPTPESSPAQVAVTTLRSGAPKRGEPKIGDDLRARARVQGPHAELRIYRGTTLIARCPGDPRCQGRPPHLEITLKLTEEGSYRAVAFSSDAPIPAPGSAGLDSDVLDAGAAGATILYADTVAIHR